MPPFTLSGACTLQAFSSPALPPETKGKTLKITRVGEEKYLKDISLFKYL